MKKSTKIFLGVFYGIWSLTGGALMSIPGLIITGFCILFLHGKPHKNGFSYIVEIGGNGGGLELGCVALCGNYYPGTGYEHTRRHEFGHSIQQLIFGPLQPFIIGIPSAVRYGYDRLEKEHAAERGADGYDSIGFEGTASKGGTAGINKIENVK